MKKIVSKTLLDEPTGAGAELYQQLKIADKLGQRPAVAPEKAAGVFLRYRPALFAGYNPLEVGRIHSWSQEQLANATVIVSMLLYQRRSDRTKLLGSYHSPVMPVTTGKYNFGWLIPDIKIGRHRQHTLIWQLPVDVYEGLANYYDRQTSTRRLALRKRHPGTAGYDDMWQLKIEEIWRIPSPNDPDKVATLTSRRWVAIGDLFGLFKRVKQHYEPIDKLVDSVLIRQIDPQTPFVVTVSEALRDQIDKLTVPARHLRGITYYGPMGYSYDGNSYVPLESSISQMANYQQYVNDLLHEQEVMTYQRCYPLWPVISHLE